MKIDVIQLRGRWVSSQCDAALEYAIEAARGAGHDVFWPKDIAASSLLPHARNISLRRIRPDCDFVLFTDDDMVPVRNAIVDLLAHEVDAVSALCTTRGTPVRIAAKIWENGAVKSLERVGPGLVDGPFGLGFGFLLVRASAILTIQDYVLHAGDWLAINSALLNRLEVPAEKRDREAASIAALRDGIYRRERWLPVFQLGCDIQGHPIGEDAWFSRLLHLCGFKTFIDSDVLVGHMGDFPYSPLQLGINHPAKMRFS
jgi:hypothetical protein